MGCFADEAAARVSYPRSPIRSTVKAESDASSPRVSTGKEGTGHPWPKPHQSPSIDAPRPPRHRHSARLVMFFRIALASIAFTSVLVSGMIEAKTISPSMQMVGRFFTPSFFIIPRPARALILCSLM